MWMLSIVFCDLNFFFLFYIQSVILPFHRLELFYLNILMPKLLFGDLAVSCITWRHI